MKGGLVVAYGSIDGGDDWVWELMAEEWQLTIDAYTAVVAVSESAACSSASI